MTKYVGVGGQEIFTEGAGMTKEAEEIAAVGVECVAGRAALGHQHLQESFQVAQ